MAACVVVADDLTGANATGVLLTKMQYRAATIMSLKDMDPEQVRESDCLLYPTDSRGVDPQEAYRRVYEASERLKEDSVLLSWAVRQMLCWTVWARIISRSRLPAFRLPEGS